RRRLRSHLEGADVAFKATRGKIFVGIVRRNAPEDGRPLDARGENAPLILTQASGHEVFSLSRACPPACPWRPRSPLWQAHSCRRYGICGGGAFFRALPESPAPPRTSCA